MNVNSFMDGIIPSKPTMGVNIENPENDKLIHEAIIFDELGGNMNAVNGFYSHLGKFGARDGILNESAAFDTRLHSLERKGFAKVTSILAVAQESASEDYELYRKAVLLMEAAMNNMAKNFDKESEERLEQGKKQVAKNPRIQDALDKIKSEYR